jgi:CRP-like cAMP-binding protein
MTDWMRQRNDTGATSRRGPSLRAIPFHAPSCPGLVDLLSANHHERLVRLGAVRHFPARAIVYREGDTADAVFIIGEGAVKSCRDLRRGRRRISAFLFAHDVCGLAEAGRYVNTVQALTPSSLYRLDLHELSRALQHDSELEFRFLCRIVHELREAQQHAVTISRRHAAGRLALLLRMLEANGAPSTPGGGVQVPMTRSDIADYLGLSLESVVRASRRLERQGIVTFPDRHHARVLDRRRFEALASAA